MTRVLVVAAHPDDELLGLGATVARHVEAGDEVTAVIVSEGATSRYAEGADRALRDAAGAAAAVLGVRDLRFLGMEDQRLDAVPLLDVVRPIEKIRAEIRPDVVYAHHWGDLNRDHRVVSEAAMVACRPVGDAYPRRVLCFETPSSTEWSSPDLSLQFVPTVFVDATATIEKKLRAMACYATEVRPAPHPRSLESLRARAQYWGQIVGRNYAEAFVLVRDVS
ncbi:MAG TPA: PIG-L deacetylase family protein [Haliangiales bacterium]|nr:PIG-L deacetylase family protein [Haliangiales bacterium]